MEIWGGDGGSKGGGLEAADGCPGTPEVRKEEVTEKRKRRVEKENSVNITPIVTPQR